MSDLAVPATTAQPQAWRDAFEQLPESVKKAIWDHALTSCPACGSRGVAQSWAVVTAAALGGAGTEGA